MTAKLQPAQPDQAQPTPAQPKPARPKRARPLRLLVEPIVDQAQRLAERVRRELPTHDGLAAAAEGVAAAALQAQRVSQSMNRIYSPHRLPAVFLAAALLCLGLWVYWRFFHVATLTIALPDRDAASLREQVAGRQKVHFRAAQVPGSREALGQVIRGEVDLAFVQGGLAIPADLPRLETPSPELVLFLTRGGNGNLQNLQRVLTSLSGEGSHTVAQEFFKAWGVADVEYVHEWRQLTTDENYEIDSDIDAVFVVKDPADEQTLRGVERLAAAGFRCLPVDLGARGARYDFLKPARLERGYLRPDPAIPEEPLATYGVRTYLVARRGLTPRLLAQADHMLDSGPVSIAEGVFEPTTREASDIFQGIEAFLGIIVNIGLAFLALLGLDVMAYRKQFHELNSLVSLLSMLQSNKDVLGLEDEKRKAENLLYLGLVSDLLGLLSMISSYYTQENSSLLFNNLSEVIHQRCDGLKINIQLKILHATVQLPREAAAT
jgi:hypothetical protein